MVIISVSGMNCKPVPRCPGSDPRQEVFDALDISMEHKIHGSLALIHFE
ncbi:MAG: hypothetical protein JRF27_07925 [Deltaproteobacteria bacterium]|nr:hypothetical protein [Deltaproteobacteria bacterium]